jgi:hypothetical protein
MSATLSAQHDSHNATSVNTNQSFRIAADLAAITGKKPKLVDWAIVAKCKDERAAIVLCVNLSNLAHETIWRKLDIDKGYFSRIMSGRVTFPGHKRCQLMALCENLAPVQFEAMKLGLTVFENQLDRQERELEEALNDVRIRKEQMFNPFLKAA